MSTTFEMTTAWTQSHEQDGTHIVPDNDLKAHVATAFCWCKPELDFSVYGIPIYTHNSLDRRELEPN